LIILLVIYILLSDNIYAAFHGLFKTILSLKLVFLTGFPYKIENKAVIHAIKRAFFTQNGILYPFGLLRGTAGDQQRQLPVTLFVFSVVLFGVIFDLYNNKTR